MRIGVVTVHNGQNYGASLQAYALVQALRKYEENAYLIDYRTEKIEKRMKSYSEYRKGCSVQSIKYNLVLKLKEVCFDSKRHGVGVRRKFQLFHEMILDNKSGIFYTVDELKSLNEIYDTFICGSDQIWNRKITDLDGAFFLEFADTKKNTIAYAPSIGMPSEAVESNDRQILKEKLQNIGHISIREENNRKLIEELAGRKCDTVVDPVLLLEYEDWEKIVNSADDVGSEEPYAFYYPVVEQPEMEKYAMKEAKRRGWKLINPRLIPTYAKLKGYTSTPKSEVGPAEFLKLLANAEAVFTNSFHATVFSAIFKKELFIIPLKGKNSNRNNRMFNFLKNYDLLKVSAQEDIIHLEKNDYEDLNQKLRNERNKSLGYLENALYSNRGVS